MHAAGPPSPSSLSVHERLPRRPYRCAVRSKWPWQPRLQSRRMSKRLRRRWATGRGLVAPCVGQRELVSSAGKRWRRAAGQATAPGILRVTAGARAATASLLLLLLLPPPLLVLLPRLPLLRGWRRGLLPPLLGRAGCAAGIDCSSHASRTARRLRFIMHGVNVRLQARPRLQLDVEAEGRLLRGGVGREPLAPPFHPAHQPGKVRAFAQLRPLNCAACRDPRACARPVAAFRPVMS